MDGSFWQYALGPIAVALGGAITIWWQSRQKQAEKQTDAELQRDHDDLTELRAYRARIDEELQKCRSSEEVLRADITALRVESAGLQHQIGTLRDDLQQALAAITKATERITTLEAENASLEMTVRVISTERDALKARLHTLENEVHKRRAGQLRTRKTDHE